MTDLPWSAALAPFLLACALLLLPGLAVGWAARLRPALLLTLAPALSLGVIAAASIVGGAVGIGWSALVVGGTTAVVAVVAGLLVRGLRASQLGARWPSGRLGLLLALGPLLGLALSVLLQGRRLLRAIGSADAIAQSYDTSFHLNAVALTLESGNASPLAMTLGTPGAESGFYPNLWHSVAALLVQGTGAGIPTATNALVLATTLLLWPLSVLALVWVLVGPRPFLLTAAALLAFSFPQFPNRFLSFGILYPNLLAYAALPAVLALVGLLLRALGVSDPRPTGRLAWLAPLGLLLVALLGLGIAHPSAVIAWAILAACLLLGALGRWTWRRLGGGSGVRLGGRGSASANSGASATSTGRHGARPTHRRSAGAVGVVALVWVGTLTVLAVVVVAVQTLPALAMLRPRVAWPPQSGLSDAIQSALDLSTRSEAMVGQPIGWATAAPLLSALAIVGLVLAAATPRWRWLVLGYGVTAGLWIVCVGLHHPLRDAIVTFWYGDQNRLAALLPMLGIPLAVLGVDGLVRLAVRVRARRAAIMVLALAALAVGTISAGRFPPMRDSLDRITWMHDVWPGQERPDLLTEDEAEFMARAADIIPEGESVIVNPRDGGALIWALEGVHVLSPVPNAALDDDRRLVAEHLVDADTDPAVCEALADLNTSYVMTLGAPIWEQDGDPSRPRFGYSGIYRLEGVAEVVEQTGDMQLLRVTACA